MRLRSSFLAKITMSAITSSLLAQTVFAHQAYSDSSMNMQHPTYYDNYSAHPDYLKAATEQAKALMDMQNMMYEKYKKVEYKVLANPQAALDVLIQLGNSNELSLSHNLVPAEEAGKPKYALDIKYSRNMNIGEVAFVSMSDNSKGQATATVTVHESARTNPFVLLESFVNLNQIFDISSISGNKTLIAKGKNLHHHNYEALHTTIESLSHTLGLTMSTGGNASYGITSTMELLELKANADAGSITAKRALAERQLSITQTIRMNLASFTPIKKLSEDKKLSYLAEYAKLKGVSFDAKMSYADALMSVQDQIDLREKRQMEALNASAKLEVRRQNKEMEAGAAQREEVVKTKSLSEMVKANDRAGVADAMEKIFPWAIMEPTEKTFWRDYIDAIRHPNYEGAHILFRGMDEQEKFQEVRDAKGKVVSGGLFSKRLTAGSGSHFYKLKGLQKTFETFGTDGVSRYDGGKQISPLVQPHTLTKMMSNHASNPNGSPFISLSYDLQIAKQFGTGKITVTGEVVPAVTDKRVLTLLETNASGGIVTLHIDKRRTLVNTISGFNGELEVLASMLIFPDEVLYMEKGVSLFVNSKDGGFLGSIDRISTEDYYKNARRIVYQKTGIILPEDYRDYAKEGQKSFQGGLSAMQELFSRTNPNKPMSCSKVFK
ncbi:hypothetical protein B9G69_006445 [Bdellovibrio sp. SKB1291214]|uniref:hypothetical protein n=1 Tax=Bdellovibrio sp. SKB1291214 TaxID=1732569 RepID=UPI000B5181BE|nr:hypothetical protein [Bdellovibrio sp. SKB1291214]UYL10217.1 hypothetical protein B9G69_006445 [Bdellovibrio sp. SKB1291214]